MFNNHTLQVITDLSVLGPHINNVDHVAIAAVTSDQMPSLPNIYDASILIPPTEILMRWADGDEYAINVHYIEYLKTEMPDDMIVAILALLTVKDVFIYIPRDEFEIFGMILLNHIYQVYGVICGTPTTQFSVSPYRIPLIMCRFYMINTMTADDFLAAYPGNMMLPDFVIPKLASEKPLANGGTFQQYAEHFNRINASKFDRSVLNNMVRMV